MPNDYSLRIKPKINHVLFGEGRTILRGELHYSGSLPQEIRCHVASKKKPLESTLFLEETFSPATDSDGLRIQVFSLSVSTYDTFCLDILFTDSRNQSLASFSIPEGRIASCFKEWKRGTSTSDAPHMYNNFMTEKHELGAAHARTIAATESQPLFSIIVPLYHTPLPLFSEMTASVLAQSYQKWELVLVNSTPDDTALANEVETLKASDSRITVVTLPENLGITGNTNCGVKEAKGDFICFFDHDDVIEPDILEKYAQAIEEHPETDMVYCDEDVLFADGTYGFPNFKADFSIDQLRNNNYICHMLCIRKSVIDEIGPTPDGFDGAQDHWLTLRASEIARKVWHIRKPLYHWRAAENSTALDPDSKPYATQAGIRAVQDHLDRIGLKGHVSEFGRPFTYKVSYSFNGNPDVSIVLWNCLTHDSALKQIEAIKANTEYRNFTFLCVFKKSVLSPEQIDSGQIPSDVTFVHLGDEQFFSELNTVLFAHSSDFFVFMDRYIKPTDPTWLTELLGFADREGTGIIGPKIINIDNTTYQAGYAITPTGVHELFVDFPLDFLGYGGLNDIVRNVSAIPSTCMVVKSATFKELGGFSTNYKSICWDADLCEKALQRELLVTYVSNVSLQSLTFSHRMNASGDQLSKVAEKYSDQLTFMQTWKDEILKGDSYYSQNFDYDKSGPLYCSSDWLRKYNDEYVRTGVLRIAAKAYHAIKGKR